MVTEKDKQTLKKSLSIMFDLMKKYGKEELTKIKDELIKEISTERQKKL
jgi:vacuolar-type H+-ATPase subunit B/Vma2